MTFATKKIAITGGAGFIGSNLVDGLLKQGARNIVVLDNLETGSIDNIREHIERGAITFIQGDIRNTEDCARVVAGCDIVFHQAALGSVPRSIQKPLDTHATNVTGFINMLDAARLNKVGKFIYASSSSVYGDDTRLPKKEENVGRPLSPYAVSKKTNELYAAVYADLYQMDITGLRYFNVFGPRQNPLGPYAAVIPIFISKLLKNEPCRIYGDGTNRRDFTYVSNVVKANLLAANAGVVPGSNRLYNVAFGHTETVNSLYQRIREKIGSTLDPVYEPPRPGEIKDSFADTTQAQKHLGYMPEVSLEEGISHTIAWYKSHGAV